MELLEIQKALLHNVRNPMVVLHRLFKELPTIERGQADTEIARVELALGRFVKQMKEHL